MHTVSIDRTTDSIDSHLSEVKEAQKSLNNKKRKVFAKNDPDHRLREKVTKDHVESIKEEI